ncbi:MAG: hypothetical protein GC181_10995, partial [Bacteroidetes bacterium]|nr:hypothetical protein [Bacteroidota bacterium]
MKLSFITQCKARVFWCLFFALGLFFNPAKIYAQLSGTYTIDPSGSGGTNFTSFTAAVSSLNSNGVNGNVIFNVAATSFSNNITISSYTGGSTYDVVFKGAGISSTTITYSGSGTIILDGCDRVTFRDMTIAGTGGRTVQMVNTSDPSDNCSFRNCKITTSSSTSSAYSAMYSYNNKPTNLTIDSCDIQGGYYCVEVYGGSSTRSVNFTLSNSSITNYYYMGLYFYYSHNGSILNNYFEGGTSTGTVYSCYIYYMDASSSTTKARISGNMFAKNGSRALYVVSSNGYSSTLGRNEMYNNVILGDQTYSTPYVCYMSSCSNWNIYHNSFASTYTSASSTYASLYNSGSYNDVKNNVFISSGNYPIYFSSSTGNTIDYNNYYNWSGSTAPYAASGAGSNSVSASQGWTTLKDLSITDGCVNGTSVGVSTDIEGNTRNSPPDMGAYEAASGNNDAGVFEILSPVAPITAGTQTVTLAIKNYGGNNISSLEANYQVASATPVNENLTLTNPISPCDVDTFTLTTGFTLTSGCVNVKTWTSSPNSSSDPISSNDTLSTQIGLGKSGTFTIGGSGADYASIDAALSDLSCGGVSGPVIFKIASGTYSGQVNIPNILGTSPSNTIIFKGAGISSTKLTFSQSSSTADYATLAFDGCSYVEFREMTIEAAGSTYGWSVNFRSGHHNTISNCKVMSSSSTTSSVNNPVVIGGVGGTSYSAGGQVTATFIDSCEIIGGYFGIVAYGSSTAPHDSVFTNSCSFSDYYYYGIYHYYCQHISYTNNRTEYGRNTSSGIAYYQSCPVSGLTDGPHYITGNILRNNGYMYLYYADNPSTNHGQFINNIVTSKSSSYAIYWYGSSSYPNQNWDIYNNTIVCENSVSYGLYMYYTNNFDFRNNIINLNSGGSYCWYNSTYAANGSNNLSDYNNFYNNGGSNLCYQAGTTVTTSNLTSMSGYDTHSISATSPFIGSGDYHLSDACSNRGTNVGVTTDVDGDSRNNPPLLGADEVPSGANDVGLVEILSPNGATTSGAQTVKAVIKNLGSNSLGSVKINYQVAGSSVVTESYTPSSSVATCTTDTITFTTTFNFTSGCKSIRVWTSEPNSSADGNTQNDTMSSSFGIGLSGTYTVGGSGADFNTIQDAIDVINCSGLGGTTILQLPADTFNAQWVINSFSGTSSSNRLVIKGMGKDKTLLTYNQTSSSSSYATLTFNGCSYVEFRDMTIEAKGTSYGWAVNFLSGDYNSISNCRIQSSTTTTSSSINSVVVGGNGTSYSTPTTTVKGATVDSCLVSGGYFGIVGYGSSSYIQEEITVKNSTISDYYYYGIYQYYAARNYFVNNTVNFGRNTSSAIAYYQSCPISGFVDGPHTIMNNTLNSIGYVYLYYAENPSSDPGKFINNIIYSRNSTYGIYWYGSSSYPNTNWKVYHNTIYTENSVSYGIYSYYFNNFDMRNNIFHMNGGASYCWYNPTYGANGSNNISDYNIYYNASSSSLVYQGGTTVTSSNLNSLSSFDTHSYNQASGFKSSTDFHLSDACAPKGASVGVTTDIDGDTRNSSSPQIGADEVPTGTNDAGISEVTSPNGVVSTGTQTVQVKVKNFGSASLSTVKVHYQVGSSSVVTETYTPSSSLSTCSEGTYSFSTTFNHTQGCNQIRVWTSAPNTSSDDIIQNDTASASFGLPMSGSYTVGGSGANFPDFKSAVDGLNCAGVSGPVVININPGTYDGNVVLNNVSGMSSTNTVTFKANSGSSAKPVIQYSATGSIDNYVIRFDNASNYILDGLNLISKDATNGRVIEFINSNSAITIKNNRIESALASTSSNLMALIFDNTGNTNISNNITIDNNDLINGSMAIYCYGYSSSALQSGWVIKNNRIKDYAYYGMYLYYTDGAIVSGNDLTTSNSYTSSPYNIYTYYGYNGLTITSNRIHDINGGYGIYQYYNYGSSSAPSLIANNFIQIGNTSTGYGIYSNYSSYQRFYHNSVNITSTSGYAGYFYYSSSSYSNNDVKNNIFVTKQGYALYVYNPSNYITSDYNDLYASVSGTYYLYDSYNGNTYNNIAGFTSATGLESNSVNFDPKFYAYNDLHCITSTLDSAGSYVSVVTTDIDGETRRNPYPSIGADEYTAIDDDAGISAILSPSTLCSSNEVKVTIKNTGEATLYSATINWSVNGTAQTAYNFSGNIASGSSTDVVIGTFTSSASSANIVVWTTSPNSVTDLRTGNDTSSRIISPGLAGTFTVGGTSPDYATLGDALRDLENIGICGDVALYIRQGTYIGNYVVNNINGTGPSAMVSIMPDPSNTSPVVLQHANVSTADNFVFKFNGSSHITLKGLTLQNTGSNVTYTSLLINSGGLVEYITIDSCKLIGLSTTTTSNYSALIRFYTDAVSNHITIKNNTLLNGGYGIYLYGSSAMPNVGNAISGNTLNDMYYMGIYNYYGDSVSISNNTIRYNSGYSTMYGSYIYYSKNASFTGNTINMISPASAGIATVYGILMNYSDSGVVVHSNRINVGGGSSTNYAIIMQYDRASLSSPNLIYNNMLAVEESRSTPTCNTLYLYNSPYTGVYYNNLNNDGGPSLSTGGMACYTYISSTIYENVDFQNNIFRSSPSGSVGLYINGSFSSTGINEDYNNFDADYLAGTSNTGVFSDLSFYQSSTGFGGHSHDFDPYYTSTSDLHANNIGLYMAGTNLGLTDDIDGETRLNPPSIGANELLPDINVVSVASDTLCGAAHAGAPVIVTLKNSGNTDQMNIAL